MLPFKLVEKILPDIVQAFNSLPNLVGFFLNPVTLIVAAAFVIYCRSERAIAHLTMAGTPVYHAKKGESLNAYQKKLHKH